MKIYSHKDISLWMITSFLLGAFGMLYLVAFTKGTAINNQNKINQLIKQCEASLPRDQSCEIVMTAVVKQTEKE